MEKVLTEITLGRSISKKLSINVSAEGKHADLWRGIRSQIAALLNGLDPKDVSVMLNVFREMVNQDRTVIITVHQVLHLTIV